MTDYPPEVQAVLDKAQALMDYYEPARGVLCPFTQGLRNAVAAYRKSIAPPEPFERLYLFRADGRASLNWEVDDPAQTIVLGHGEQIYRCTVTPTEVAS